VNGKRRVSQEGGRRDDRGADSKGFSVVDFEELIYIELELWCHRQMEGHSGVDYGCTSVRDLVSRGAATH